ncbi:nucleosome assembly protein 1-like 1 [Teleopsis dalmanni]|uniref:nucleosome assembly protein 1-like 1 n=1 Tax=Teleopsis dalmanni TaxID=139649 RepID=UPI0018CF3C14|nr:nucleosome assembly protein 1-like 1 [Teleopsis dalmanni]XP_037960813.1 nucleosome assembly protein 1-like 1 [Teleopsis dalmanni]
MANSSNSNMDNVVKSSTESGSSSEASTFTDEKADKKVRKFQPALLDAAERRHFLHEMVKSFPQSIKDRITVLKNIQLEQIAIDSELYKEINNLEVKYVTKFQKFYDQRFEIVSGKFDPPEQDPKWKEPPCDENAKGDHDHDQAFNDYKNLSNDSIGIPSFWLEVLRSVDVVGHLIQDHDVPILRKLIDVREKCGKEDSFALEFHFDRNDYFTDEVLIKKYFFNIEPNKKMPFQYDGPIIWKSEGCLIHWKKDMNLTLKTVKEISKDDANKMIFKNVPRRSFFHFFNPPLEQNTESIDKDMKEVLNIDYDLGLVFRSRIISRAVLYFTGELPELDPCACNEDDSENEETDESNNKKDLNDSDEGGAAGGDAGGDAATAFDGATHDANPLLSNQCKPQ